MRRLRTMFCVKPRGASHIPPKARSRLAAEHTGNQAECERRRSGKRLHRPDCPRDKRDHGRNHDPLPQTAWFWFGAAVVRQFSIAAAHRTSSNPMPARQQRYRMNSTTFQIARPHTKPPVTKLANRADATTPSESRSGSSCDGRIGTRKHCSGSSMAARRCSPASLLNYDSNVSIRRIQSAVFVSIRRILWRQVALLVKHTSTRLRRRVVSSILWPRIVTRLPRLTDAGWDHAAPSHSGCRNVR